MENIKLAGGIVADQFKLDKLITSDSLNQIWEAIKFTSSRKERVTLKFEDVKFEPKLRHECSVYMYFDSQPNIKGQSFPKVIDYLTIDNENIMITESLGPNLEQLFDYCNRKFSLKTVLMLANQMLKRIEYVHSCRLIHRDIKPKNFRIGAGIKHHLLYMTNFRNAVKYLSSLGKHLKFRDGIEPTGTMRFASINSHIGIECSRRDDMESLAYLLIYLLKGELPWQNLKASSVPEKFQKILDKKVSISVESLCEGIPREFSDFLVYCRCLEYEQKPNYRNIKKTFAGLFSKLNYKHDGEYDWMIQLKNAD